VTSARQVVRLSGTGQVQVQVMVLYLGKVEYRTNGCLSGGSVAREKEGGRGSGGTTAFGMGMGEIYRTSTVG
jgi:hypothetical protein